MQCRLGRREEDKPRHEGSEEAGYWMQSSSPPVNQKGIIKHSSHRTSSVWMQRNTRLFSSYPLCLSVSHKINSTNESLNSMFDVSLVKQSSRLLNRHDNNPKNHDT